jgi:hypothetical protein
MESLKSERGLLYPILSLVKQDITLCLQIRESYINIYYRGGSILKFEEQGDGFKVTFNRKYLAESTTNVPKLPSRITVCQDVHKWLAAFPHIKHEMDLWFTKHPKNEREFQQLLVRENNLGKCARSTDYFICDIEYANLNGRFDLVAVHWPSSGASRKNNKDVGLALIEMKYADSAIGGKSGLLSHINGINNFLADKEHEIKDEMRLVFNQLLDLGLVDNQKKIEEFSPAKPECIIILANHDPGKTHLIRQLRQASFCYSNLELRFALSNFMGYGLYEECIFPLGEFLMRFEKQIGASVTA